MSPEAARQRAALRLAFGATLALVWGTTAREPLPGLTAVLAAQILVGMARPLRLGQAAAVLVVIAVTGGLTYAVGAAFANRPLILLGRPRAAVLPWLFHARAGGRAALASRHHAAERHRVVPVLTVQAEMLGAGVVETLVTAAARAMLVVWLLHAILPAPREEPPAGGAPAGFASAAGTTVTRRSGVARTLAKVAIVLPAEFFYLTEPSALAFPALLGLVTFLSTQDPAAGRAQLVILLLGNLVGSVSAAVAAAVFEVVRRFPR